MKNNFLIGAVTLACLFATNVTVAKDVESRGDWLRGSWGLNWKPTDLYNGAGETLTINLFLESIKHLKTIDYVQVHLNESYIYSPSHLAPHDVLENLWRGDVSALGEPINLVVPRASTGVDPFLEMIKKIQKEGMKVQVYLNSSNMLERGSDIPNPGAIPNITERWKEWVDTTPEVQAFINSQPYHTGIWDAESETYVDATESHPERKYMFAYAEFILKEYAVRYGELIDGWLFDSGYWMSAKGDNATNGVREDQKIYEAFANACHAGNPNAAISFNNSPNRVAEELNPFSEATHFDDYMFGHPYNGGRYLGNHDNGIYERNYAHIEKITETNGNVHANNDLNDWAWDDKVIGHFDPPMSRTRWNSGTEPGLTDEEFVQWNYESAVGGGAISWGAPLYSPPGTGEQLLIRDWGMAQLELMDADLAERQEPGAPNWARAHTVLTDAILGEHYSTTLVNGQDFWDPEGDAVTLTLLPDGAPSWLQLVEDASTPGNYILQGQPIETEETYYEFLMLAEDASGVTERLVKLRVGELIVDPVPAEPEAPDLPPLAQIYALPDHDYGVDNIATMESALITVPDGVATFKIAFDVAPTAGTNITSGATDNKGASSANSWGVSSDNLFKGSDNEAVNSLDNIRVTNFNANGSCLSVNDITQLEFFNAEIANAQSSNDRVLVTSNGVVNAEGGLKMGANVAQHRLNYDSELATSVTFGVGNESTKNKWSINHIEVAYQVEGSGVVEGDFDNDCVIGMSDYMVYRTAMGSSSGDAAFVEAADLDNNGVISRTDFSLWYQLYRNQ